VTLLLLCALLAQDADEASRLIERIGAGGIEEREEAERRLEALGHAAEKALEGAARRKRRSAGGRGTAAGAASVPGAEARRASARNGWSTFEVGPFGRRWFYIASAAKELAIRLRRSAGSSLRSDHGGGPSARGA
jgi:hypothetical protein